MHHVGHSFNVNLVCTLMIILIGAEMRIGRSSVACTTLPIKSNEVGLKSSKVVPVTVAKSNRFIDGLDRASCGKFSRRGNKRGELVVNSKRVVMSHGSAVQLGQFPSFVLLQFQDIVNEDKNEILTCGGTLIASDLVITAAHCVKKRRHNSCLVRSGFVDSSRQMTMDDQGQRFYAKETQSANVRGYCIHNLYNETTGKPHDLAVLQLDRKFVFNDYVQPACLLVDAAAKPRKSETLYTIGFGWFDQTNRLNPQLSYLTVQRVDCPKDAVGVESQTCYKSTRLGEACPGDSGSGLFVVRDNLHFLAGFTSNKPVKDDDRGRPNACLRGYSDPVHYFDVIKEKAEVRRLLEHCYEQRG